MLTVSSICCGGTVCYPRTEVASGGSQLLAYLAKNRYAIINAESRQALYHDCHSTTLTNLGECTKCPSPPQGYNLFTVSLVLGLTNQNRRSTIPNASPSLCTTNDQSTSSYRLLYPARISRNERLPSSSSRGNLPTPAEAYRTPGRGTTEGGVLLAGGNRARQAPASTGVSPDMEDSIMRGPLSSNMRGASSSVSGDGAAANASAAAEELVKKFRQENRFF